MVEQVSQKVTNTFTKGLITEASQLNMPPDASIDEANCDLLATGTRRRRKGLRDLGGYTATEPTRYFTTFLWESVGNQGGLDFYCVQNRNILTVYRRSQFSSFGDAMLIVDLGDHYTGQGDWPGDFPCRSTVVQGNLILVNRGMFPLLLEYNEDDQSISTSRLTLQVRDFSYQTPKDELRNPSGTLNVPSRLYDTYNSGWLRSSDTTRNVATLGYWISQHSNTMPALRVPPWSSKNDNDETDLSAANWSKTAYDFSQSSLNGNGRFIFDAFNINRDSIVSGATNDIDFARPNTVATYAGRIFYAGINSLTKSGNIYFSKIVEGKEDYGICYQENDPTAEYFSDLLPTDGGVLVIQDVGRIHRLHVFGNSLFVFAENGVWEIFGPSGVFTATEYGVNKVTSVGIIDESGFVSVEGVPFWFSTTGISTLSFSSEQGRATEQNISKTTIQTFIQDIPSECRNAIKGVYDRDTKRIFWLYSRDSSTPFTFTESLILDVTLQSFFPWKFYGSRNIRDIIVFKDSYSNDGVLLKGVGQVSVIAFQDNFMMHGDFAREDFRDWDEEDAYAYVVGSYEFSGSAWTTKSAKYVMVYMDRTSAEDINSSLWLSSYWDFDEGRGIATRQQCYRLRYNHTASIVKVKILGRGKVCVLRWDSEEGKDFRLIGFVETYGQANRI